MKLEEITNGASLEGVEPGRAHRHLPLMTASPHGSEEDEHVKDQRGRAHEIEGACHQQGPRESEPGRGVTSIQLDLAALLACAEPA